MVGAEMGPTVLDAVASVPTTGVAIANPMHTGAAGGGLAGMHDRGQREAMKSGITARAEAYLFELDEKLRDLEAKLTASKDRKTLKRWQRMRLDLLDERGRWGQILIGPRTGAIDEAELIDALRGKSGGR
jgi:hypothetical protein